MALKEHLLSHDIYEPSCRRHPTYSGEGSSVRFST